MKPKQLNIFGEAASAPAAQPKRARKRRQAKKAPMLVDAFESKEVLSPAATHKEPHIHSVSEITDKIKNLLEKTFTDVWLTGEVTDFRNRTGRHLYFALKDERSKIRVVMFGADGQRIPFDLADGLEVICHGKMNIYGPQGQYSIVIDYIEPKGKGALQLAFEQLKKKLETEGLFDRSRKKPLPFLPKRIGVITSPTGAAIRDIVHVLTRRFPNIEILLHPVRVQGEGAAPEIVGAIQKMNEIQGIDLLIVGRGGGSIEDLWAFNEEIVARAIAASKLPIISAVGHEIDFTIADFVADVRAATPSAAAEIAVPVRDDLFLAIADKRRKLMLALKQIVINRGHELKSLSGRISDPRRRFPDLMLRIDGFRERLIGAVRIGMERQTQMLANFAGNLEHLSPLGVLAKGYAVAQKLDGAIVNSSKLLKINDELRLRFHNGGAHARVTKIID